jgi:hypothetical protein
MKLCVCVVDWPSDEYYLPNFLHEGPFGWKFGADRPFAEKYVYCLCHRVLEPKDFGPLVTYVKLAHSDCAEFVICIVGGIWASAAARASQDAMCRWAKKPLPGVRPHTYVHIIDV